MGHQSLRITELDGVCNNNNCHSWFQRLDIESSLYFSSLTLWKVDIQKLERKGRKKWYFLSTRKTQRINLFCLKFGSSSNVNYHVVKVLEEDNHKLTFSDKFSNLGFVPVILRHHNLTFSLFLNRSQSYLKKIS